MCDRRRALDVRSCTHMLVSIPPKYAVAQVIGFIKGKSTIQIARYFLVKGGIISVKSFGPAGILLQQSE